jgi:hypothetical protein
MVKNVEIERGWQKLTPEDEKKSHQMHSVFAGSLSAMRSMGHRVSVAPMLYWTDDPTDILADQMGCETRQMPVSSNLRTVHA